MEFAILSPPKYKVVNASCDLETDCKMIVDAIKGCTAALSEFGLNISKCMILEWQ